MVHFAAICPEIPGHLNPMTSFVRELTRRGHRVTFYQRPLSVERLRAGGFDVRAFGEVEFPADRMREEFRQLAELGGRDALVYTVEIFRRSTELALRVLPDMLREDKVNVVLADQVTWAASTTAEALRLPYVTVCNALVTNSEPTVPPFVTSWRYRTDWLGRLRNNVAYRVMTRIARPMLRCLNEHRQRVGLPLISQLAQLNSPYANITQLPREFDYPRRQLPANFHFVGPMRDAETRPPADFPFDKLDGRPLIYASMGTLQNRQQQLFGCIAAACAGMPAQLVISLGGGSEPASLGQLPGSPIVVKFAPQLELLKRAALCITHAGLNTALECLAEGVPMVAIPITNDQPGVAARIEWTGSGEFIPLRRLTTERLRLRILQVLVGRKYLENATRLKEAISRTGGPREAAEIAIAVAEG